MSDDENVLRRSGIGKAMKVLGIWKDKADTINRDRIIKVLSKYAQEHDNLYSSEEDASPTNYHNFNLHQIDLIKEIVDGNYDDDKIEKAEDIFIYEEAYSRKLYKFEE